MNIYLSYYPILHDAPIKGNSLSVLKQDETETQRFGYISGTGQVKCYQFRKNKLEMIYKSDEISNQHECLTSDGDNVISGYKKSINIYDNKGNLKKNFKTPFDDNITHISVHNSDIFVASGALVFILSSGTTEKTTIFDSNIVGFAFIDNVNYVGISTGYIYSFSGKERKLLHTLPAMLNCFGTYTTRDKKICLISGGADCYLRIYNSSNTEISSYQLPSPPVCFCEFDVDGDGCNELFVSMENGNVAIVSFTILERPDIIASIPIGYSATNISVGYIYSPTLISAVVTSASGHIGLISAEPKTDRSLLTSNSPKVTEDEISYLTNVYKNLQASVKQSKLTKVSTLPVQCKISLRGDLAAESLVLVVESDKLITRVSFSANIPLLKASSRSECQTIITMSKRRPPYASGIIKPVDKNGTRVSVDIWYETGKGGELQVYVNHLGTTIVTNRDFILKPFGMFKKLQEDPYKNISDDSLSILEITNTSNSSLFHDVIGNCLPNPLDDNVPVPYASGCTSAPITVKISGEKFVAKSLFLPIITQLRNYIIETLTEKSQRVTFETKIGENYLRKFFDFIEERFLETNKIASEYSKLIALREVKGSNRPNVGNDEVSRILADASSITQKWKEVQSDHAAYENFIKGSYLEIWQRKNINATDGLLHLKQRILNSIDKESINGLIKYMQTSPV